MARTEAGFDITLKVLNYLKTYKHTDDSQIAISLGVSKNAVIDAIRTLSRNGYVIEAVVGRSGGRIYKGKKSVSKKLTKKEKKWVIKKYSEGESIKNLTDVLGVSRHSIYYTLDINNIETNREKLAEKKPAIEKMYSEGYSLKEIADTVGVEMKYLKSRMYNFVEGDRRNKVDREKIKEYIKSNPKKTGKEIAAKFEVSEATVSIVKRSM